MREETKVNILGGGFIALFLGYYALCGFGGYFAGRYSTTSDLKHRSAEALMKCERRVFRTRNESEEVQGVYIEEPPRSGNFLPIDRYLETIRKGYEEMKEPDLNRLE